MFTVEVRKWQWAERNHQLIGFIRIWRRFEGRIIPIVATMNSNCNQFTTKSANVDTDDHNQMMSLIKRAHSNYYIAYFFAIFHSNFAH